MIKKHRDLAIILLLLRTGMRIGELLSTRISDVNFKEKRIDIHEAQKNRAGRVVYFCDDAGRALKKWKKTKHIPEATYDDLFSQIPPEDFWIQRFPE